MGIDDGDDERPDSLLAATDSLTAIDIEDRLRRVKRAAGRPRLRRRLSRLTGEPARTDRVLLAAAGSACATTAVLTYLWWRDGRRRHPGRRSVAARTLRR